MTQNTDGQRYTELTLTDILVIWVGLVIYTLLLAVRRLLLAPVRLWRRVT